MLLCFKIIFLRFYNGKKISINKHKKTYQKKSLAEIEEEQQILEAIKMAANDAISTDTASLPHYASRTSMLSALNGAKSDVVPNETSGYSSNSNSFTPHNEPASYSTPHASQSYSAPMQSVSSAPALSTVAYVAGGLVVAGGVAAAAGGGGSSSTTTAPTPSTTSTSTSTSTPTPTPTTTTVASDAKTSTSTTTSTSLATSIVTDANDIRIDALVDGDKYGDAQGTGITITYSFPWTSNSTALWSDNYGTGENTATTHYGLSASQMDAARLALQSWGNLTNVTFVEVAETSTTVGDIRFAFSSTVSDTNQWGWSYTPSKTAEAGDVWIATNLDAYNSDFSITGVGFSALIHELGHTLGLKHCGDTGAGDEGPFLDAAHDNKLYSAMSYNIPTNNMWFDTSTNKWVYVMDQTPMIYDILAIQYIYGANTTYKTGDDTYTFDNIAPFRTTIWDAGGADTISVANSTRGSIINLNEGSFSSIQTTRFYSTIEQADGTYKEGISATLDGTYNLGIAYGAIIENAIGGSGNDTLIGNQYTNSLTGGAGADTFVFNATPGSNSSNDRITDFSHNDDTIKLDDAVFTKLAVGALSSDMFKTGVATDSNDHILYDSKTGYISYDLDGNGGGAAIVFATLTNKPTDISSTDFVII